MNSTSTRPHHQFDAKQFPFELWRLQDEEYKFLRQRSFPIQVDGFITLRLELASRREGKELMLPKVLVALEEDFGPSSTYIDTYKQTFSFPLLLRVTKAEQSLPHILKIADYRGGLEFNFYRIVDAPKYVEVSLEYYHKPIADELNESDLEYLIAYLWGYLESSSRLRCLYKVATSDLQPFFRHVDSSHVIYGFVDGEFFERCIDDTDEYEAAVQELQRKYGEKYVPPVQNLAETQAMLQAICGKGDLRDG